MQKTIKVYRNQELITLNPAGTKMFELLFLKNDEDQSVEVVESPVIDFNAIIEHLGAGNSIFIAPKIQSKPLKLKRNRRKSAFVDHV